MVYVLNIDGRPVMPTENHAKVRVLLKQGKAKVVRRTPFTVRLLYDTPDYTQEVSLGVDAGYRHIGLSVTTETKELYASDVELRGDIVELLSTRRELRSARRNRKTRYRQPRFDNRTHAKHKGWLAPSVDQRIGCHITAVIKVCSIIPVSHITVETASFDTQLLKALGSGTSLPEGTDYQNGEQLGFWNVREYVLFRDGHQCQCCRGKSKDRILNVHHIESRKTGGDSPSNLITLCETCHKGYHRGTVKLPVNIKKGSGYKDAAFMGISRWTVYSRLKEIYPNVHMTFGYLTKNTRIRHELAKEHYVDARCISGHPEAEPLGYFYYQKKVRCHNRQIHKNTILKGGYRKRNQADYLVKGFRLFDKIQYKEQECFIFGRRARGYFDLRKLDGTHVHRTASYKELKLLEKKKNYLTERRMAIFPTVKTEGSLA